jgi:hypothetical protein
LLGGSSFQVTAPIFCFSILSAIVSGILSFFLDDDDDDYDEDFVVGCWLNADNGIDSMCRLRGCLFVGSRSDMWKCNPGCFLDL